MSEDAPKPAEEQAPPVRLLGQFIKDLSFEVPHAPEIYSIIRENPPEIPIGLDTSLRYLSPGNYEITLKMNIEASAGGKTAFIFEIAYAALVQIDESVVPSEAIHPILLIEIPRQLYPFVRQIISDMTYNGGFPPLMLQMVDFAQIYQRKFGVPSQPAAEQAPVGVALN
jgi:preprotein translocase subunit SecB